MIQFSSSIPRFRNYLPVEQSDRDRHDTAELTLFMEGLSGGIDDWDIQSEDMGLVIVQCSGDLQRWDYVTRYTLTPKVEVTV